MTSASLYRNICSNYNIIEQIWLPPTEIHLPPTYWASPYTFVEVGVFFREVIKHSPLLIAFSLLERKGYFLVISFHINKNKKKKTLYSYRVLIKLYFEYSYCSNTSDNLS